MAGSSRHPRNRTTPWHDPAVDRIHARARFSAAITLVALMGATLFGGTITALMNPLIAAVQQIEAAQR